jgi:hypothetical protein
MTVDWSKQLYWEDVNEGDEVPSLSFPLSLHRMIVQAGANRDFAAIHINTEAAQAQGAPEMYINNVFHQGMWEKTVREYIGLGGVIKKMGPFRMKIFGIVGEINKKWQADGENFVELGLHSEISAGDAVVGTMTVTLPSKP